MNISRGEDMEEEYEILPKSEIDELKRELKAIKENPFGDKTESITLLDSMNKLTDAINSLLNLFENTKKELAENYKNSNPAETMNEILEQNQKIAKGTLAVANLVKDQKIDLDKIHSAITVQQTIPKTVNLPQINSTNPFAGEPGFSQNTQIPQNQQSNMQPNASKQQSSIPIPIPSVNQNNNFSNNSNPFANQPSLDNIKDPFAENIDQPTQDPFANDSEMNNFNSSSNSNNNSMSNPIKPTQQKKGLFGKRK